MALHSTIFSRGFTALICRNFHGSSAVRSKELERKLDFFGNKFCQMGLYHDDVMNENDPDVAEAVRRLPDDILMQRKYRAIRAQQAELNNSLLPKDQWIKVDDENHYYLQPFLKEVILEREERERWEATH